MTAPAQPRRGRPWAPALLVIGVVILAVVGAVVATSGSPPSPSPSPGAVQGAGTPLPPGTQGSAASPPAVAASGPAEPSGSPVPAASVEIAIRDFAFDPPSVTVPAGTTVTWTNEGGSQHTATAEDGSFDTGVLAAGGSASHVFDTPGTWAYICAIHPDMKATITVQGPASS